MIFFIEHLTKNRAKVTQTWVAAIQSSPAFDTPASASLKDLMDHMPDVYDDMVDYLRNGVESSQARRSADQHGSQRWTHRFRISDLAREILLLRTAVARELDSFQATCPQPLPSPTEQLIRVRLTHFFDEAIIDSVRQFTSDQQAYTDENDRILSARAKAAESAIDDFQQKDVGRLRLLRVIAHELRNFLNAASLVAEALQEENDQHARKEMDATLARTHQQMGDLLNHLLEAAPILSAQEPLHLAPLNLSSFTRQEAPRLEHMAAAKSLSFQWQVASEIEEVVSDEAKLRRVVINLVQNAIKYTDAGSVNLEISRSDNSHWALRVSDTGPGIPPEQRTKIFEEFHRIPGSEGREGAGLGLAIVKHLVGTLSGQIRVESEVGQGTSFIVLFPINTAA
jgi:signal transduction histidine kinase